MQVVPLFGQHLLGDLAVVFRTNPRTKIFRPTGMVLLILSYFDVVLRMTRKLTLGSAVEVSDGQTKIIVNSGGEDDGTSGQ